MRALYVAGLAVCVFVAGCDDSSKDTASSGTPKSTTSATVAANPSAPTVKALPFTIEGASFSDLYKGKLKVADVEAGVTGGTQAEWAATSIAIAEKLASYGADSVEVKVMRQEIHQPHGDIYRVAAHTYYSPNPDHTVWEDHKTWTITSADPSRLITQRDVDFNEDYQVAYRKFLDQGHDDAYADAHAGAIVEKKYHPKKGWALPVGNDLKDVPRDSMNVDASPAAAGLAILDKCLGGKMVYMVSTCE